MKERELICLKCSNLVWQGFLAYCIHILMDYGFFEEAM